MPTPSETAQTLPHHTQATTDPEYNVTLHPAVVSQVAVTRRQDASARDLYRQSGVQSIAPEGIPKVWHFRLAGGERDVDIRISDPRYHIASIQIELRPSDYDPLWGDIGVPPQEVVTVQTGAKTCPPYCQV